MNRTNLIDRDGERTSLHELLERPGTNLALMTGRRRIGKTYLLTHVWEGHPYFLFTAARTTQELNRRQLLKDLAAWTDTAIHPEDYPTWRSVFRLLLSVRPDSPLVVVLDEFQYLGDEEDGASAVASELNAVVEHRDSDRQILIVLSGSAVGTMEALAAGGGPLYGRFDAHFRLKPFTYEYAAEMTPFENLRDRALAYGVFGGTPRFLSSVKPRRSLADNITNLSLAPTGEVRMLIESALDQEEGLRDTAKYRAILQSVAAGCTHRNEIAQRCGLANDHALRQKIDRLIELDYLKAERNFDAKPNEPIRHRVNDAAFRFHKRFVGPSESMLERYPAKHVWKKHVRPHLNAYMGPEFERIAVQAYDRCAVRDELPLVRQWGRWEGKDRLGHSLEIDILGELDDKRMMSGSVKWSQRKVGPAAHEDHMIMLRRLADSGREWAHRALDKKSPLMYVSAAGFTDRFLEAVRVSGHDAIVWTLDDLYA